MRIISGKARGTKLVTIEEDTTRPTLDRVKESLFNIIQSKVNNSCVLDLFAGSGALGIEALSRGARKAYFCDTNKKAVNAITQNLEKTKLLEKAEIFNKDFLDCLNHIKDTLDIVFLDPPYKLDLTGKAVKTIIDRNLLSKDGIIIVETDEEKRDLEELESIPNISVIDKRKYGRASLIFIKEEKQ